MKEILFDKTHRGRAFIKVLGITALTLFMLVSTAGAATFAYITNQDSNTVSVIDISTNVVTATVSVGTDPSGVSVVPERNVYIANAGSNDVSVIDSSTNTVKATVNVGSSPNGVAASTDGTKVYVTNYGSNTVSVIDAGTNTVTATVTVGNHPFGVAVAGTNAYVTNDIDNTVSVIDTSTDTVTATINLGDKYPGGIAATETMVYVTSGANDTLSVIDTSTNTVTATVPVGDQPTGVALIPVGDLNYVYVANYGSNNVSIIDTTNTVTATVSVGKSPYGVATTPDGAEVYVANSGSNNVSVIDTNTNTIKATVDVENVPKAFGQFIGQTTELIDSSKIHITRITTSGSASDPHVYGDRVVYVDNRNGNADIYIYDLSTKSEIHTNDLSDQVNPAIYQNNVVWEDYRNGGPDIYLLNLSTKIQTRITTTGSAFGPDIYGDKILWGDGRFWVDTPTVLLCVYDISKKTETLIPIPKTIRWVLNPAIYNDRVVYLDGFFYTGVYLFNLSIGSPDMFIESTAGVVDIYGDRIVYTNKMYDLSTKQEIQISDSGTQNPAIYNNRIVWEDYSNGQNIHMYDIPSSKEVRITTSGSAHNPDIYGNRIVWVDENDIYVGDLNNPIYPVADLSSNVTEGYAPLTVSFTYLSENETTWNWDFGDEATSIEQDPVHTYSTAGIYTANLTVSNSNGTDSRHITIKIFYPYQEARTLTKIASNVNLNPVMASNVNSNPVWSPSGSEILFSRDGLYKVSSDGSGEEKLAPGDISQYAWSPDGSKISYIENNDYSSQIHVINADGTGKTQLLSSESGPYFIHNWFPSGSKILYAKCRTFYHDSASQEVDWTQLGIINSDGSNKQEFDKETGCAFSNIVLSPDASKLAYSVYRGWDTGIRDLDQNSQDFLLSGLIAPQTQSWQPQVWSPDSSKIVYWSSESGNDDIYTINSDGTGKTQLTAEPANENSPIFSPDGSRIAYVSDEMGSNDILVMDADGSNNVHLTADTASDVNPVWSPDGTKIAFCSDREGDYGIYILTLKKESDSVSNLQSTSGPTWINWTWTNPSDPDFNHTEIYLNGTFQTSTSAEYFNTTGLQPETSYTIGTRTVDLYGNVNPTWVNATATTIKTPVLDNEAPVINSVSLNSTTPETGDSINVTVDVTDNVGVNSVAVSGVTLINAGGNIWEGNIVAVGGTHSVNVSAVDTAGNIAWNNSTSYTAITSDNEAPVINLVSLSDNTPHTGDSITVTVDVTDNVGVTSVVASGVSLVNKGGNIWEGNIVAVEGTYIVSVSASDAAGNTAIEESASYTAINNLPTTVEAEVNFSPSTLKLGSSGQWVTVYIELPEGYNASGINASSVLLNGAVSAVTNPKYNFVTDESEYLTDIDQDGVLERMLKFDWKKVESVLKVGNEVTVTFTGKVEYNNELSSGIANFEGSDVIKVTESNSRDKTKK